jgi:hypothetical protein
VIHVYRYVVNQKVDEIYLKYNEGLVFYIDH